MLRGTWYEILEGDALAQLRTLPDNFVHCVVTSSPYWGLRDYGLPPSTWGGDSACNHAWREDRTYKDSPTRTGKEGVGFDDAAVTRAQRWTAHATCTICGAWRGCLGLEPTPELFVRHLTDVFREVRRVLRADGTCWLNLGDSWAGGGGLCATAPSNLRGSKSGKYGRAGALKPGGLPTGRSIKSKDLVGIPWMAAFALRADGWYLRQDIVWHKPNPMPESVTDRCTKAHEYLFLLTKSERYYFDHHAIQEPAVVGNHKRNTQGLIKARNTPGQPPHTGLHTGEIGGVRNKRSVWSVTTKPFKGAHFATFPPDLIEPCVLAGTSAGGVCRTCGTPRRRVVERAAAASDAPRKGSTTYVPDGVQDFRLHAVAGQAYENWRLANPQRTTGWRASCKCPANETEPAIVLDPFGGAGTTAVVALKHKRHAVLCELNPKYVALAVERIEKAGVACTM